MGISLVYTTPHNIMWALWSELVWGRKLEPWGLVSTCWGLSPSENNQGDCFFFLFMKIMNLSIYIYLSIYLLISDPRDEVFLFFKLNSLGWHLLINLDRFPVYNSVTHHLYVALCVYLPESDLLSSPYVWPLLTLFSLTPPSFPSASMHSCLFALFVHLLLSVLLPTYEWNHVVLDFFCLIYFAQRSILKIHLCCCKWQS